MPTRLQARPSTFRAITVVWMILVGFTLISWWLGSTPDGGQSEGSYVVASILIVTFVKIRLVIVYFMEVHEVPAALRAPFEVWCVVVCAALIYVLQPNGISA